METEYGVKTVNKDELSLDIAKANKEAISYIESLPQGIESLRRFNDCDRCDYPYLYEFFSEEALLKMNIGEREQFDSIAIHDGKIVLVFGDDLGQYKVNVLPITPEMLNKGEKGKDALYCEAKQIQFADEFKQSTYYKEVHFPRTTDLAYKEDFGWYEIIEHRHEQFHNIRESLLEIKEKELSDYFFCPTEEDVNLVKQELLNSVYEYERPYDDIDDYPPAKLKQELDDIFLNIKTVTKEQQNEILSSPGKYLDHIVSLKQGTKQCNYDELIKKTICNIACYWLRLHPNKNWEYLEDESLKLKEIDRRLISDIASDSKVLQSLEFSDKKKIAEYFLGENVPDNEVSRLFGYSPEKEISELKARIEILTKQIKKSFDDGMLQGQNRGINLMAEENDKLEDQIASLKEQNKTIIEQNRTLQEQNRILLEKISKFEQNISSNAVFHNDITSDKIEEYRKAEPSNVRPLCMDVIRLALERHNNAEDVSFIAQTIGLKTEEISYETVKECLKGKTIADVHQIRKELENKYEITLATKKPINPDKAQGQRL